MAAVAAEKRIERALGRLGLTRERDRPLVALAGGVSSEIYRVELTTGPVCVKQALAKLRVAGTWRAPVERSLYEARWLETVAGILPAAAPGLVGFDEEAMIVVMDYLDPADHPLWKTRLRDDGADLGTAESVGTRLGKLHGATANDEAVSKRFDSGALFEALRIEPYLLATAERHPDCAGYLRDLAAALRGTAVALVHGDVSPKNILCGPQGPVFLDAETACYGDPAFDLAFCLNHLTLKCLWRPAFTDSYVAAFLGLWSSYRREIAWEAAEGLERRCLRLLPALQLARIDGRSPVEYLTAARDKNAVRGFAKRNMLSAPAETLEGFIRSYASHVQGL